MSKETKPEEKRLTFEIHYSVNAVDGCDISKIIELLNGQGGAAKVIDVKLGREKEGA